MTYICRQIAHTHQSFLGKLQHMGTNNIIKATFFGLLTTLTCACTQTMKEMNIDRQVNDLYDRMTQEERIAQLYGILHLENFFKEDGTLDTVKCEKELANGAGHFSQYAVSQRKSPQELRDMVAQMQNWLINNTHNGIPALFHEEVISGIATYGATVYPQQIGLACSFNTELAEKKTQQTANSLRKIGGAMALSPMVDVVRNPSFNRLEESYGEDGYLSAAMGVAFVKGLQGDGETINVAACSKHFLGYGGGGDASEKELMEDIILPHQAIISEGGSQSIMTGYHAFQGTKCVTNEHLQKYIIRDYLEFQGITVSDYWSIDQADETIDTLFRAVNAFNAGNDVDFPNGDCYRYLPQAIEKGLVKQEDVEAAVKRVLRLKAKLGLLNKGTKLYGDGEITLDTPEERETAYQLATQSVVLLKNNNILPLKGANILLTGPNANSMWAMLGDYTYHSMRYFWQQQNEDSEHPHIVSLKEGLFNKLPKGFALEYTRGCDWTEGVETVIEEGGDARAAYMKSIQNRMIDSGEESDEQVALQLAAKSDVIIAAVGENVILCGENRDRTTLRLPGKQESFVKKLIATGKPVVLVIFGGRAQVISGIAEQCAAIIQAWYPGEEGGNALADILYGNVSPSGKLSVSYPNEEIHEAVCYNYGKQEKRIAYPFGYGLTYTTFEYDNLKMDSVATTETGDIKVSCEIRNTGNFQAEEIVQLYVSPEGTSKIKPIQLQGFKRISLNPGESGTVDFTLNSQQFGYYDLGDWIVDEGEYIVKIGASSADIRLSGKIKLTGERYTDKRKNFFAR